MDSSSHMITFSKIFNMNYRQKDREKKKNNRQKDRQKNRQKHSQKDRQKDRTPFPALQALGICALGPGKGGGQTSYLGTQGWPQVEILMSQV